MAVEYDHQHKTVAISMQQKLTSSSRLKPAFGTKSAQRMLPYGQKDDSPGPGAYQPEVWGGPYEGRRRRLKSARAKPSEEKGKEAKEASPKGSPKPSTPKPSTPKVSTPKASTPKAVNA